MLEEISYLDDNISQVYSLIGGKLDDHFPEQWIGRIAPIMARYIVRSIKRALFPVGVCDYFIHSVVNSKKQNLPKISFPFLKSQNE